MNEFLQFILIYFTSILFVYFFLLNSTFSSNDRKSLFWVSFIPFIGICEAIMMIAYVIIMLVVCLFVGLFRLIPDHMKLWRNSEDEEQ